MRRAVGKPPSMGINKTILSIQGKLGEVNSEANYQLHVRNKKIQETVYGLELSNGRLEQQSRHLANQNDELNKQLREMQAASKGMLVIATLLTLCLIKYCSQRSK